MHDEYRNVIFGLVAFALSSCAPKAAAPNEPSPSPRAALMGRVEVTVGGFESNEGQALIALFLDESGWPNDETLAFGASALPIENLQAVAVFDDVPAGPFAISVFHDKDLDRELDTGVFGIPTEAYGFSRDARNTFGPPSFEEARLDLSAGQTMSVVIRVD